MDLICRLCLSRQLSSYIHIFSPESIEINLQEKIHKYLQIKIDVSDNYPQHICLECKERILQFCNYSDQCQLNQDVFELQVTISNVKLNSVEVVQLEESDAEEFEEPQCDTVKRRIHEGDFPKFLIRGTRLILKGRELTRLFAKFYRLECEICQTKELFKDIYSLFSHYKAFHLRRGFVVCCGSSFTKTRLMALHMARHLQPEAFQCTDCGKMMTCPKILQIHKQNHLPEEQRPLACKECPRRFSYNSALLAHLITHLPEDERKSYECAECGKGFVSSIRLSSHISSTHPKQGHEFVCHICAKQFATKGNLSYHLKTHQPVQMAQCKECGKWLRNKICLRKHQYQHSTVKHKCDLCPYEAVNIQCLRNHMKTKHSADKPHKCTACSKEFKLKTTLLSHMAQHTGEKRYACQFCKRQFASSGNYYAHRKRMHAEEVKAMKSQKENFEANKRKTLGIQIN